MVSEEPSLRSRKELAEAHRVGADPGPRTLGPVRRVRQGRLRWDVQVGWEPVVRAWQETGLAPGATVPVIKDNRVRRITRWALPDGSGSGVIVKQYRTIGWWQRVRWTLLGSPARREWIVARFLAGQGFPVPMPRACGEVRWTGLVTDGVVVLEEIPGAVPAFVLLADGPLPTLGVRRRLLAEAAAVVRRLHDAGIFHQDLHTGNLLIGGLGTPQQAVHLVDLHRISVFGGCPPYRRWWNLAQLAMSCGRLRPLDQLWFLKQYAGTRRLDRGWRAAIAAVSRLVRRLQYRLARSRARRSLGASSQLMRERRDGYLVRCRRDVGTALALEGVERHRGGVGRGARRVLKASPRTIVTVVALQGPAEIRQVCVKEYRSVGRWGRIRDAFRRTRALRAWMTGHALQALGIDAPQVLACLEDRRWGRSGRAYLVTEALTTAVGVDRYLLQQRTGILRGDALRQQWRFVEAVARVVRRMHGRGVYPGDLKACNVLVREQGPGQWRVALVDLDDVRFARRPLRRHAEDNLAQLMTSTPDGVTDGTRARFLRAYLGSAARLRRHRPLVRRVLQRARRRAWVWVPLEGGAAYSRRSPR